MTAQRSSLRRALALVLAAAAAPALALDVNGSVGAGYFRSDSWSDLTSDSVPSWDLSGQLSLAGSPLRPGLLTWNGMGEYRRYRSLYSDSTTTDDNVNFAANASLFSDSPLSLQLNGGRTWSDFATSGPLDQTGSTRVGTWGGRAHFQAERAPTISAGFAQTSLDNRSFGVRSQTDLASLDASIAQSVSAFQYALAYGTSWNSGTFAESNYRSHSFSLQSGVELAPGTELRLNDQYFLRDPTTSASTNPRYDDNSFMTSLSSRASERVLYRGDYQYRHFVMSAPDVAGRDTLDHVASAGVEYRVSEAWTWTATLGASAARDRLGTTEIAGSTEQVGGGARWQRPLGNGADQLYASGGASAGVQQRDGADSQGAWGVNAGAGWSTAREGWTGGVSYSGGYSRNLAGEFGSTLSQQVNANADTRLDGWLLRNALVLAAARRDSDVGASSVSRSIQLSVTGSRAVHSLQLAGGLVDGASGDLRGPGDGLFLPATFNTRSRYVALTGNTQVTRKLSLFATARYTQFTAPGRARQWEQSFSTQAQYTLGLFALSLDERFSVGGYGAGEQRANLFFFRITRYFGASF